MAAILETAGDWLPPGPIPGALQPEKRLLYAVLEGAVSDFQKYATAASGRGRRLFADADAWLRSTATDRPIDFENLCHALGLDPSFIRAGLQRWRSARQRETGPSRTVLHLPFRRPSGTRHRITPTSARGRHRACAAGAERRRFEQGA